jgi:hypothetical protein
MKNILLPNPDSAIFCSSLQRPERFWGPLGLLSKGVKALVA